MARAHSTGRRVRAIEQLLHALGVGVYSGSGRQIVGGFERGPAGIYLYDFEVRLLAEQWRAHRLSSLNQLASQLRKAHERLGHRAANGHRLAVALAKGIRRLQRSRTPAGALAQTVLQLGLLRHVNLMHVRAKAAGRHILDPLQRLLVAIDATRSATHLAGRPAVAHRLSRVVARATEASAAAGCQGNLMGAVAYGKGIGTMLSSKGKSGGAGTILQELKDGLDGVVMAYSVGIRAVRTRLTGSFGQDGPHSARPMRFRVRVIMRDDYTNGQPGCGRLAGYSIPRKGGIPGVPVLWERNAQSHLTYLGSTPSCRAVCVTRTDSQGVATMTFRPDDEYLPGVGPKVFRSGSTTGAEFSNVAQHNILGTIAQAIGFNKAAAIRWEISYHHPAGYRVSLPAQTYSFSGGKITWAPTNLEVCLEKSTRDIPHPLRPFWNGPLTRGGPVPKPGSGDAPLGAQAIWSGKPSSSENHPTPYWGDLRETIATDVRTYTMDLTPFTIPIGFDTTGTYQDNNMRSRALWSFTGPTLRAHITLFYELPPGKSRTFDVPVTQAKYCPFALR